MSSEQGKEILAEDRVAAVMSGLVGMDGDRFANLRAEPSASIDGHLIVAQHPVKPRFGTENVNCAARRRLTLGHGEVAEHAVVIGDVQGLMIGVSVPCTENAGVVIELLEDLP